MRYVMLLCTLYLSVGAIAQRNRVFSVTDIQRGGAAWNNIRQTDERHDAGQIILSNQQFSGSRIDVQSKEKRAVSMQQARQADDLPMHSGVAGLAYDARHQRLYYTTMFGGDVRFVQNGKTDINQYYHIGNTLQELPRANNSPVSAQNQGPVITRLTMGADDFVYGLSNDGTSFFRVSTTARQPVIENLGNLINHPENGAMSVHSSCSSWGGDLVASADGDLYLFTMYQHVFRIEPNSKVAAYLGKIDGLPADFTVNGAAVDANGAVMLSSAAISEKIAIVNDVTNLKAELKTAPGWYNASDLASGNLLFATQKMATFGDFEKQSPAIQVDVFPNPVTDGQMIIHFKQGMEPGKYAIDLLDNAGGNKMQSSVNINGTAQRVTLQTSNIASGLYLLRVTHTHSKKIETIKVLLR